MMIIIDGQGYESHRVELRSLDGSRIEIGDTDKETAMPERGFIVKSNGPLYVHPRASNAIRLEPVMTKKERIR